MSEERKAMERLLFRAAAAVVAAAGAALLLPIVWDYLSPFIIAIPVAAMISPLAAWLEHTLHLKRAPAVLIPVLIVCVLLALLIVWFASFGIGQLTGFLNSPHVINDLIASMRSVFDRLFAVMASDAVAPEVVSWMHDSVSRLLSWLTDSLTSLVRSAGLLTVNMAAGVPYTIIYANFLIIGIYFITKDYDRIRAHLPGGRNHAPNSSATRLTNSAIVGLIGYLRMQTTYALLSLAAGTICFELFGFRYAFPIALAAATLEFLPLFGNGTLYIPWSLLSFVLGDTRTGTLVIVLYLLLITIRRVTEPALLANSIGVSPLASLIGMFVGLKAGGILGLVGGPVVMSVLGAVWQGTYLDAAIRDVRIIIAWFRRRWAVDPASPVVTAVRPRTHRGQPDLSGSKK